MRLCLYKGLNGAKPRMAGDGHKKAGSDGSAAGGWRRSHQGSRREDVMRPSHHERFSSKESAKIRGMPGPCFATLERNCFVSQKWLEGQKRREGGQCPGAEGASGIQLHFRHVFRDDQLACGQALDFLDAHAWRALQQVEGTILDLEEGEVRQHATDAAGTGQR